jgi:outer membrane protein assembly factor BamE
MMIRLILMTLAVLAGLSGCGFTQGVHKDTFKPYVPDVVQGNFVSREQRQYLRPGMTRAQVRDVLGTPLVTSLFHADRWDYAFSIRRQGVPPQQFNMTLYFSNDVLSRIESDELPSEAEFVQRLSGPSPTTRVPSLEASEEQLKKYPVSRGAAQQPAAAPQAPLPSNYPPLESAPR